MTAHAPHAHRAAPQFNRVTEPCFVPDLLIPEPATAPRNFTQAVVRACRSFATTSKDAVDKVNDFVAAYNQGGDVTANEGPAIDTLNHSADLVEADSGGPLSDDLHHALNAYIDAARDLAAAVRSHGDMGAFNQRVNQFNDTKSEAVKLCRASL